MAGRVVKFLEESIKFLLSYKRVMFKEYLVSTRQPGLTKVVKFRNIYLRLLSG